MARARSGTSGARARASRGESALIGIWGRPYIDVSDLVTDEQLRAVHEEITLGLVHAPCTYTGGSLKWMGVTAPWHDEDGYADLNHVIAALPQAELNTLWSLGDTPEAPMPSERVFGEETDNPLNQAQMRWLELRHGVYFPWKTCFHFINNERWEDKHDAREFSAEVLARFPKTVALLRSLPFVHIGRAVLFGVHPNDHAPYHRDSEPGVTESVPHSLSVHPDRNKKLWLASADGRERRAVDARVFWFNDMDYHGVEPTPTFRYSIRVDGKFDPAWLRRLAQRHR